MDNRKKRSKHANGMSAQEALKARRQRIDPRDETEDDSLIPMVKLNLPASLKKVLVDDWENITIAKKLLDLPRPVTVRNVLDAWIESKRAKSSSSSSKSKGKEKVAGKDDKQGDGGKDASKGAAASGAAPSQYDLGYIEIAAGLRAYFDRALGSLLLYRFEREQVRPSFCSLFSLSLFSLSFFSLSLSPSPSLPPSLPPFRRPLRRLTPPPPPQHTHTRLTVPNPQTH